jgi:hypothetical protein
MAFAGVLADADEMARRSPQQKVAKVTKDRRRPPEKDLVTPMAVKDAEKKRATLRREHRLKSKKT